MLIPSSKTTGAFGVMIFLNFVPFLCAMYILQQPSEVSGWEIVLMVMLHTVRALTLAVKYAFYGDRDMAAIGSSSYRESDRMEKKMLITWGVNGSDTLHEVMLEELCEFS
jgi:hypothetical protein